MRSPALSKAEARGGQRSEPSHRVAAERQQLSLCSPFPWRASGRLAFGLAAGKVAEAAVADLTAESTSHPHSAWLWIGFDRQAA